MKVWSVVAITMYNLGTKVTYKLGQISGTVQLCRKWEMAKLYKYKEINRMNLLILDKGVSEK